MKLCWNIPLNIHWIIPLKIHDDFWGVDFWFAVFQRRKYRLDPIPCGAHLQRRLQDPSLSIYLSIYLSISLSLSLYIYIYIYIVSIYLSLYTYIHIAFLNALVVSLQYIAPCLAISSPAKRCVELPSQTRLYTITILHHMIVTILVVRLLHYAALHYTKFPSQIQVCSDPTLGTS